MEIVDVSSDSSLEDLLGSSSSSETILDIEDLLGYDLDMCQRKEDENNQEIIRGLMELPANRLCINCNSEGPPYVCTTFWTFVCIKCSEIHRKFGHGVKSVYMDKFTSEEVKALQREGNEHAMKVYFRDWGSHLGSQRLPETSLPDSSNTERLSVFIEHCYVYRRYTGEVAYLESECVENTESCDIPLNDHIIPNPNLNPMNIENPNPNQINVNPNPPHKRRKTKAKAEEEEIQEKRRKAKGKEVDARKKKKIGEVVGLRVENPENALIIRDLPAFSLPTCEFVRTLRNLSRLTVGVESQPLNPLKPVILYRGCLKLKLPYPWKDIAMEQMTKKGIEAVEGEVRCLDCGSISIVSLDWREAWVKSASYMFANFILFGEEIYSNWTPPSEDVHIKCELCREVKGVPHISPTVEINWLFLFLTNMVSYVPAPLLEEYIRSRGIQVSETPSKKELMFDLYIHMLQLLDPKGGWAGLFCKQTGVAEGSK